VLTFSGYSAIRHADRIKAAHFNFCADLGSLPTADIGKRTPLRLSRIAAVASRTVGPAPFEASAAEIENGVRVIEVRGELDLSTAPDLEAPLDEAIAADHGSLLLDLSACEFIDSTGIALIVRAWQRVDGRAGNGDSGRVVICCQNDQVRRVLEVTGLESSIAIFATRDEALAALRG
jgi:anti-sigma B factor antagonist